MDGIIGSMSKEEPGIITELAADSSYGGYLPLDVLLSAQRPGPKHHHERLFIIQHQTAALWMKLMVHELTAAIEHVKADSLPPCFKILARVKQIQRQLFERWGVLGTLPPSESLEFRDVVGPASGLQSFQFRAIEFLLGNKNARRLELYRHDEGTRAFLDRLLRSPSIYDEFLRHLGRRGMPVPLERVERDWSQPYE